MLRKLFWVPVVALALLPAVANAQFKQGDWDLTLSGNGNSDTDFNNTALSFSGSVGYFFIDPMEVGLRQTFSYASVDNGGDAFAGITGIFTDYHFDLGRWQPFVGTAISYTYGDGVQDTWLWSFEGGVKYFVNSTTYIYGVAGYGFNLDNAFSDGAWNYGLGIGFRF